LSRARRARWAGDADVRFFSASRARKTNQPQRGRDTRALQADKPAREREREIRDPSSPSTTKTKATLQSEPAIDLLSSCRLQPLHSTASRQSIHTLPID